MPFVAELYFDPSTEKRIRKAWQALDEAGVSDSMPKGGYRPHISLGICEHLELETFAQELSAFAADIMPFRLPFPNIGIFSTSEGVVYWGATATKQLLDLHTKFHEIFKKYAKEQREYYTIGQWVPHCTLAFGLSEDQIAEAVSVCRQMGLPVSTEIKGIGLVEVSSTDCRALHVYDLNP